MSSLNYFERAVLEGVFGMGSGYVLDFSDRTFREFIIAFVGIDPDESKYHVNGPSKAKRLRAIWEIESDAVVAKLTSAMLDVASSSATSPAQGEQLERARAVVTRLRAGGPALEDLGAIAQALDAEHLATQIARLDRTVKDDPAAAIGGAKELIETTCRTILRERGVAVPAKPDVSDLTKLVFAELKLVADDVDEASKGRDTIKRVLGNLQTMGVHIAELRNLYGTGHGKDGSARGLGPRHARLAVGSAATLCRFLFETHEESRSAS